MNEKTLKILCNIMLFNLLTLIGIYAQSPGSGTGSGAPSRRLKPVAWPGAKGSDSTIITVQRNRYTCHDFESDGDQFLA
jgi:hypothetical protein